MMDFYEMSGLQASLDAHFALKVATAPTVEPISVAEAKAHLRIRDADTTQDTYIQNTLIPTARQICEGVAGRSYITQTLDFYLDYFPDCAEIWLPRPPLQSVTSIVYTLDDGTTATVSSSTYVVDTASEPGRVILKTGEAWPSDVLQPGASVRIRYVAGYGASGATVPQNALRAMYLLLSHLNENRELLLTGTIGMPVPWSVDLCLMLDRNFA